MIAENRQTPARKMPLTLRGRIMRVVIPLVMGAMLLIAFTFTTINTNSARARAIDAQVTALSELRGAAALLQTAAADTLRLANNRDIGEFAADSVTMAQGSALDEAQRRVIAALTTVINAHRGDYLAARYVTYTGSVWTEVTSYEGGAPVADTEIRLNELQADVSLQGALNSSFGSISAGSIEFYPVAADRVAPFVRLSAPVASADDMTTIAGAVQIDVRLSPVLADLARAAREMAALRPSRRVLITDREGRLLIDTAAPDRDFVTDLALGQVAPLLNAMPQAADLVADAGGTVSGVFAQGVERDGWVLSAAAFTLPNDVAPYWYAVIADNAAVVAGVANFNNILVLIACLALGTLICLVVYVSLERMLAPISGVTALAARLSAAVSGQSAPAASEQPQAALPVEPVLAQAAAENEEVRQLLDAFAALQTRAQALQREIETQVGRYARNLDIAARIGREVATLYDIDTLLNRAIELICTEFGFYHAQVFLIDDVGRNAVLAYSRGEVGKKLLAQGHKLEVGSASVIGRVTATGQPVIVNDTTAGVGTHRFNPLLPETRAEMALPLQLGDRIIGALDVQSTDPHSFQEDEISTFQLLADQIAVAIQNARLIVESQERFSQIDALNRQLTRHAWEQGGVATVLNNIYRYDLMKVERARAEEVTELPAQEEATDTAIRVPITIRGEVIGVLDAKASDESEVRKFSQSDHAVIRAIAERVALAIESARLFEETQNSLAETSTLYQMTRYLNEANSLEDILQAVIASAMPDAVSGWIGVFTDYPAGGTPDFMQVLAEWALDDIEGTDPRAKGALLRVNEHAVLRAVDPASVTLITDTERDRRLTSAFKSLLRESAPHSLVIIPFVVRGVWRGVIVVEFPQVREFTEREGRLFSALIDQAGVAIDNRMLLRENELALEQIARLYEASRKINLAQSAVDLLRAAQETASDPQYDYVLGLFEGVLDHTGWPSRLRIAAYTRNGEIESAGAYGGQTIDLTIPIHSPLRRREPELIEAGSEGETPLTGLLRWMDGAVGIAYGLFGANQPIALMMISHRERGDIAPEDQEVFRALSGQMSTVLQNRRLLEQTEEALDETRRLYAASRAISEASGAEAIYDAATAHLVTPTVAVTRISIMRAGPVPSPDATYYELVRMWERVLPDDADFMIGQRVSSRVFPLARIIQAMGGAAAFNHLRADLRDYPTFVTALERAGTGSVVIAPIRTRTRWFGALLAESDVPGAFDDGYTRFMQAVADQMALALESADLFQEAQSEARRALALAEVGQLASRIGGEFARSISEVLARVAEAAEYDRWLLALLDETGRRLERVSQFMPGSRSIETSPGVYFDVQNAADVVVAAFRQGETMIINDPATHGAFQNAPADVLELIGKRIFTPVRVGDQIVGVLLVGRSLQAPDLNERDEQLVLTLAAQVAVAVENRRLFRSAESERNRLRSILETLPAGVLVLDPETFKPIQANAQAEALLGAGVREGVPFTAAAYHLVRAGTGEPYPENDLPVVRAAQLGTSIASDDAVAIGPNGRETALLINAAPITDALGSTTAIVAAFQDITPLRGLERSLERSLQETIALYETSRTISEAESADDVIDGVLNRLAAQGPMEAFVALTDEERGGVKIARSLSGNTLEIPPEVYAPQTALYAEDIITADLPRSARAMLVAAGVSALVSLPLRARASRDVPMGWLVLLFDRPQDFSAERQQFLNTIGESAAVALDNRYLFRSTETALQETAALYGATTTISRARSLGELAAALQSALEALQPDLYAAYVSDAIELRELFNHAMDAEPAPFADILLQHGISITANPFFVEDLRALTDPSLFEADLMALGNMRGFGMVGLRAKGQPAGCMIVAYHAPRRLSGGEMRYLSAIADSASVVADNILLLDEIQNTLQETSTLYQASRSLSDASTPADILNIVVTQLVNRQIDLAFLGVLNAPDWHTPGAALNVIAHWTREDFPMPDLNSQVLSAETFGAWPLLTEALLLSVDDVDNIEAAADLTDEERAALRGLGLRSASILPLRVAGRPIGAIVFGSAAPFTHTDREMRVYGSFAEQAALRLEASRLLSQTERRARQLATSAQVSQIASAILDLDVLFPRIVDVIKEAFNYDHVQIFLMDEDGQYAVLRASTGEAGRQLLAINHRLEKGSNSVIGTVTATGQPSIVSDTADPRAVHRPNPYLPHTRSEMAIPLVLKGEVVGALDVQSNQPYAFDDDDVAVLTTLGAQISVAIDNAQLFQQSRKRANEMSFLFSVTTAAASAETLADALQNVAYELRDSLDALSISIYLPQQYVDAADNVITRLRPVALAGSPQPVDELSEIDLDDQSNVIATTAAQRRPLIINNVEAEWRYLPMVEGAKSAIIVPLSSGANLIGLIAAESEQPAAYDNDTLTLLLTLSGTLSAIVQNQQLLEQVQKTNEQLRELDRLKSDFLANMSHELRTPLNSIIGFSRVILKGIDGPLTEMQEQDLSTIYNSGVHLLNLINDILDQAKIAAGKMDLQFGHFEIKPLIDSVRSIGIGLVKEKPIDIIVEIAPGLPRAYGDEFRTRQVLLNLVSNAAKFTREGSITIRAYPVLDDQGRQRVRIDVADTGIGIAEKDLPLLFEAFRQVDSSLTRTAGGTGLGLPIAKSLIEMQGGEMRVESQVNVGSTFSVIMPTEPTVTPEGEKRRTAEMATVAENANGANGTHGIGETDTLVFRSTQKPDAAATNGDADEADTLETQTSEVAAPRYAKPLKRQILLIEDNPDMVDQYRRTLQREGFDIFTASIPLEAEAMASGLHPTMIIMDVNFAGGMGWEILERLKSRDDMADIPVIVVTLSADEARAQACGAYRFIRRPFLPDDLIQAVRDAERESRVERILIIDDDPESVRLLEQALEQQGDFRVFSARSGAEGIALVARRRPSLVILDLRMPEMDGFRVIEELRNNPETATIPILVVTGESLTQEEIARLRSLKVIYKTDISTERYRPLIDGVKSHLQGAAGA